MARSPFHAWWTTFRASSSYSKGREVGQGAKRNPRSPRRLSARQMVLTEKTRQRGGQRSRRRVTRVWEYV